MKRLGMPLVVSVLLACNAIAGLDDDYKLGAASGGPSPIDGSSPLPDGNSSGAPGDASVSDQGVPVTEAGVDAADAADAADADVTAPPPFSCTPRAPGDVFCWDFNGNEPGPRWGWDGLYSNGDPPNVNAAAAFQAGKGLRAKASGGTGSALIWNLAVGSWTSLTMTFRFRLVTSPTVGASNYAAIAAVEFGNTEYGLATWGFNCGSPANAPCVDDTDHTGQHEHNPANAFKHTQNQWYSGEVTLERVTNSYRGSVKVDGVFVDQSATGVMPDVSPPSTVRIIVGVFYTTGSGAETNIDNVVVRAH